MHRITARLGLTLRLFYDQFALICTDNLKNALGDESVAERVLFFQRKKQCKSDICGNFDNSCSHYDNKMSPNINFVLSDAFF